MYNSVTRAANEALLGYWNQKVAVDMDDVEQATDIISFINENPVLTPGHIIRSYLIYWFFDVRFFMVSA